MCMFQKVKEVRVDRSMDETRETNLDQLIYGQLIFNQSVQVIQGGENSFVFQPMLLEQLDIHTEKDELNLHLTPYTKSIQERS